MKGDVMPAIVKIDKAHLNELVKEVKETIATDVVMQNAITHKAKFGLIDLWKIQRGMRSAHINFKENF
jgi:translation elongation factor EF-1beta